MILHKLTALTLILSLSLPVGLVQADDEAPYRGPLTGTSARVQRINSYLKAYAEFEKNKKPVTREEQVEMLLLPEDQQWEAMVNTAVDAMADKQLKYERDLDAIAAEVSKSSNARRVYRSMQTFAQESAGADPDTYSDSIYGLLEAYEFHPEARPAIAALITSISEKVHDEIMASRIGPDPFYEWMFRGTMGAWGVMMVWSWRQGMWNGAKWVAGGASRGGRWVFSRRGAQAVARPFRWAGRGMGRGWRATMARLGRSKNLAQQIESTETALITAADAAATDAARISWTKRALEKVRNTVVEELGRSKERARYAWNNKSKVMFDAATKTGDHLIKHGVDLLKAFVMGGLVGGLYGINEDSVPVKADPLEVLSALQLLIAAKLEGQIRNLYNRMQMGLVPETADQFYKEYLDLTRDLNHLLATAPQLEIRVPWGLIAQEMKAVRSTTRVLRPEREERKAIFLASSERLYQLAQQMDEEVTQEARAMGLTQPEQRFISLGGSIPLLKAIGLQIKAQLRFDNPLLKGPVGAPLP